MIVCNNEKVVAFQIHFTRICLNESQIIHMIGSCGTIKSNGMGPDMVEQWVNPPLGMCTSLISVLESQLCFQSSFLLMQESSKGWAKFLRPCRPHGRSKGSCSVDVALTWPSLDCCESSENKPTDGRYLSLYLSNTCITKTFKKKIASLNWYKLCQNYIATLKKGPAG